MSVEVRKNIAITRIAAKTELPRINNAFPAKIEILLAGRIKTGTKGFFDLIKSSAYFILNKTPAVPQKATKNQNPEITEPAKAQTAATPSIAGTYLRLISQLTAPLLRHTLAEKNKHKSTRHVAVATG